MDIQVTSFILGIVSVLVIAMAVVSVVAIVKVMKLKLDHNNLSIWSNQEFESLKKEIDHKIGNTYKDMDSRFDKFYEKIMKNKSPKNEVFEMADKVGFKENLLQVLNKEDEGNDLKNRILQLINKTT
jgi:hypothetical protein